MRSGSIQELLDQYGGKSFDFWSEEDDASVNSIEDPRVVLEEVTSKKMYLFPNWSEAARFRDEAQRILPHTWFDQV
jgi:hypothetical protein